ncbi:nitroreductase family protein [Streptomyces physcomitrii]|uniref:Nitroreductase domain-containing protein n=1 Tax=Streptomyces physcomitrii TaxID=2724184 RepID=A0ABX1H6K6_9ACTN|nr:nitroreductase family protein [Streptomyces physcomitrii]NKI42930.1 hypothetical protein [Streptomyces physcomitrii]
MPVPGADGGPARSSVLDLLRERSSVRKFTSEPVDPELLDAVLEAALRAPTSFNFQPYSLIVVTEERRRKELADILRKEFVGECAAFVLVCGDLSALPRKGETYGVPLDDRLADASLSATIDASMVGMCLSLAASSVGLGSVMVGAVRNAPAAVAELCALPPSVTPLFGICLGRPAEVPPPRPRLRSDLVVHREHYRDAARERAALPSAATLRKPGGDLSAGDLAEWRGQVVKGLRLSRRRDELP